MNVLVINGSPRGKRSNSMRLTHAFLNGFHGGAPDGEVYVEQLDLCNLDIKPCRGCFACWKATPGVCVIRDDMAEVIQKLLWADFIVVSFPLYYFGVPGPLKNLIDRQLPMVLPFMVERTDGVGSGSHPTRYDMSGKRWILISTCGFYSASGNYDGVRNMFDHICGENNYETLFCGQGELFRVPALSARTGEYLDYVKTAGEEFVSDGITNETREQLDELLYSKEQFEAIASRECMRFESVLLEAEVDGPVIQGIVCSQSRTSEAKFKIDFNNFGHITGKYWMWSDNDNTEIPEMIAESISEAFRNYQSSPHYERLETDEGDETRYENSTENHISFCPYCGSKQYIINPNFCSVCGMKLSSTEEYFTQLNETADFSNRYSHIFSNKFSTLFYLIFIS